jgi:hypothetical protein
MGYYIAFASGFTLAYGRRRYLDLVEHCLASTWRLPCILLCLWSAIPHHYVQGMHIWLFL